MSRALRRLVVIIIGSGVGLGLAAAPARALTADFPTPCTHANFEAPARVSVVKQDTSFDSRSALHTDCLVPYLSEYFSAKWDAVDETGAVVDEVWFHTFRNPVEWGADPAMAVNDRDHLGLWRWHPVSGFTDVALPDVNITLTVKEMNSPTTDVRVGSASTVSAVRAGSKVTVSTRSSRYWTSTHAFGPWANRSESSSTACRARPPGTT